MVRQRNGRGSDTALIGSPGTDFGYWENWGEVYVYARSDGSWTQQTRLWPPNGSGWGNFGAALALNGDTALIGAHGHYANGPLSGSAYVFTRLDGVWAEQAQLFASDASSLDSFGEGVALDGDLALIGAPRADGIELESGSAYVFIRTGDTWTEEAKLVASDGGFQDRFGEAVALKGHTALVGAFWDDDTGPNSGAAYVFTRTEGIWTQQAKLLASDGTYAEFFGRSVSLDGDTAVIGASRDDDNGYQSGSAYVFTRVVTAVTVGFRQSMVSGSS